VFALGFVSVFDQIIEGIPGTAAADIFQAYMAALQEDPEKYRRCSAAGICYLPSSTVVGAALYNACSLLIHIVLQCATELSQLMSRPTSVHVPGFAVSTCWNQQLTTHSLKETQVLRCCAMLQ